MSCFLLSGYGGTSMDDIVRKSGMSKGGIYWHFKSKEEIFLYLVDKEIACAQDEVTALMQINRTALEQLRCYVNWSMEKAANSTLHLLVAEFITRVKSQEVMERFTDINAQMINEILQRGVDNGEFSKMDCQVMAELFSSLCEGIVSRFYIFHKDIELLRKTLIEAEQFIINSIILLENQNQRQ
jgi:AcrR family transcriptional regulator